MSTWFNATWSPLNNGCDFSTISCLTWVKLNYSPSHLSHLDQPIEWDNLKEWNQEVHLCFSTCWPIQFRTQRLNITLLKKTYKSTSRQIFWILLFTSKPDKDSTCWGGMNYNGGNTFWFKKSFLHSKKLDFFWTTQLELILHIEVT